MPKTILIIEDNDEIRQTEREILEMEGYVVFEAQNAKDGFSVAIEKNPDLILLDIRLPYKKRGIGLAKILRENDKTRATPIIFVSAYIEDEHKKQISSIPNCKYITKPFDVELLLEEVKDSLGESRKNPSDK